MKTDHFRNALVKEIESSDRLDNQMNNHSSTSWKEGQCASS